MTASPESLALLHRAAELRAHGTPWPETARQLATGADAMYRLIADHTRDYDKLTRRARTEAARETFDAALAALRNLLKSEDPKVSLLAATTVVRYEMARMRHSAKAASEKPRRVAPRLSAPITEPFDPFEGLELNVSESADVPNQPQDTAAKKVAHSVATQRHERLLTAPVRNQFTPPATVRNDPHGTGAKVIRSWLRE